MTDSLEEHCDGTYTFLDGRKVVCQKTPKPFCYYFRNVAALQGFTGTCKLADDALIDERYRQLLDERTDT